MLNISEYENLWYKDKNDIWEYENKCTVEQMMLETQIYFALIIKWQDFSGWASLINSDEHFQKTIGNEREIKERKKKRL